MPIIYQGSISLAKVKDGESGGPGEHGVNTATIYLYRRSVGVPSAMPIGNLTYTFATGVISATEPGSSLNGWVQNISSLSGTDPLYFIAAIASATTDTDLIASSEWQGPTLMAQDGEDGQDGRDGQDGQPGIDGFNQATISLYQRVNNVPSKPGELTYIFASGELSGNLGNWSREVPTNTNGYPCYVISAAAINRGFQDTIASNDWSNPVIMVEDGEDGADGFSPTATVTKSGHTATITITDKNGTTTQTITDGASGTSYYTYIRYSSKATPTSASDVSELPDGKDYFGIQTTTSSTVPAWNDSNWHWTKYVGEEGERGVSVTKTQEIYYLTNGNTPTKPADGVEITSTSTAANVWTKAIPTYIANYKYYTSVQTFLSGGTSPISSASVLNNGLTDANYKATTANSISQAAMESADGALSIAQGVRQYFWFQGSDYSTSIPAGTYITQIPEASFKSNLNNQPNLLLRSTSINLRYGSRVDAQLVSSGLHIAKGGIEAGTFNSDNYIYAWSEDRNDRGISINNSAIKTDWRFIAGRKFGVDKSGNLYASNVKIDGDIVAQSLTINGDNRDYNGVAALNITGYQIEIRRDAEHQSITDVDTQVYLYPLLYHNGELVTGITYTKFVWYKDDETTGIQGSAVDGGILAFYGYTYRVEYDFEDAEVDEGREIQTREIDPSKYITQTAPDGIVLHPEVQNNTTTIQLNNTGLNIIKNGISVAQYGENTRIGKSNEWKVNIINNGVYILDSNDEPVNRMTGEETSIGYMNETHALINYRSLRLIDKEGTEYFHISDLRNKDDGIIETYTAESDFISMIQTIYRIGDIISIKKNDTLLIKEVDYTFNSRSTLIFFTNELEAGDFIEYNYIPAEPEKAKGYTIGVRDNSYIGAFSIVVGFQNIASGFHSYAEGYQTIAGGHYSHAEGYQTQVGSAEASTLSISGQVGRFAHAEGYQTIATGNSSHVQNEGTIATKSAVTALGKYNKDLDENRTVSNYALYLGNGNDNTTRSNALTIDWSGNVTIAGTLTQSSDRRLKDHQSYLSTDAIQFIKNLKPVYYLKDSQPHVGFYAQEVEGIDPWNCMVGEMNGFKTLGYTEIIAPLVTYCQHLEKRIKELEAKE